VEAEGYRNLVGNWLNDAKPWLASVNETNGSFATAYSKLDRKLPADVRRSPAWMSLSENRTKFENGIQTLTRVMQSGIAADEQYVRRLNRSGGIESESVADNLRARVEFQQSVGQALRQFSQLLNQIGDGLRSQPQSVTLLPECEQAMRARDAVSNLLENSAKQFDARAAQYAAMRGGVAPANTGAAATYTIPFGEAGGLLIEYAVSTKREYSVFRNTVSGKITNTTALPIQCVSIEPYSAGGRVSSLLGLVGLRLPAGSSQSFSRQDMASLTNISASGIAEWKASCTTPLSYSFVGKNVSKGFAGGTVTAAISINQIALTVENNSDEPVEIAWNDSSFIDTTRSAKRIFHSGVKYADREQSLPNTVVPPLAKVEDAAVPAANVHFVEGQYGGWRESPLLPAEVPPELADKAIASMKGAKVALFLQLVVAGKKQPISLVFEVAGIQPGNFE
jgi:hypothetical protein